jgi:phosphoenolpyruvate carboxykinase (ATP)
MLAKKMEAHGTNAWLVNTGWSGGGYGVGERMKLAWTRSIIDAIHDGSLAEAETAADPFFGLNIPAQCEGVPADILNPKNTWTDASAYDTAANKLAQLFADNEAKFD